jgi:uncharacterized membrane protein
MFLATFSFIFYTFIISLVLQFLGSIWFIGKKSNPFIDQGWPLGRVVSWLVVALVIWFTAHLRIPTNTTIGFWFVTMTYLALSGIYLLKHKKRYKKGLRQAWKFILVEEILFAIGLISLSLIRSFNPHIQDLEKPMDAGFMASYLRSDTLPAPDIWLSGETINYYSFGHFLGSIYTRFLHLEITFTYNLILAVILGLTLAISFSIVINLIDFGSREKLNKIKLILGGLLGSILVAVGGNTHTIWYLISHKNFEGYWYADATRFIYNTIHEFPSYSFVVADIHAHVWNLPFVLSFFLIIIIWLRNIFKKYPAYQTTTSNFKDLTSFIQNFKPILLSGVLLGLFLGIFIMTSTWDVIIYSMLLAITGLYVVVVDYRKIFLLLLSAIVAVVTAGLIALPWLLNFTSISEGIALVTQRSPLWQFLALWTGHLLIVIFSLITVVILYAKHPSKNLKLSLILILAMATTGFLLLILPEVIYFKDIYSGHPRANTMFKFTYQAFIMMSLIGGWLFGTVLLRAQIHKLIRILFGILVVIITSLLLIFPYFAYPGYYGQFSNFQGLHGYMWLQEKYPSDYAAIYWLKHNVSGQPVILEAVGESYTDFARVSSYTGFPAVLGWRVHEWLWRGGFDIPGARTEEVKSIYLDPLSEESQRLIDQYQVKYIFVGDKEYEAYPEIVVSDLMKLGTVVFSNGETIIIQIKPE